MGDWGETGGWQGGTPAVLGLTTDDPEALVSDAEQLCGMLDDSETRCPLYVRWICSCVSAQEGLVLTDVQEASARAIEDGGMGQLLKPAGEALQLPLVCVKVAGSVTTFFATHQKKVPGSLVGLIVCGALCPVLDLRQRARSALSDEFLQECDQMMELSVCVLIHIAANNSGVVWNCEHSIEQAVALLLDAVSDASQDTVGLVVRLTAILYVLSSEKEKIYTMVRLHEHANLFGSRFVSESNRKAFAGTAGSQDACIGLQFAEVMIKTESDYVKQGRSSDLLYPSDMCVLAEVLQRDLQEPPGSPRGANLLRTVAELAVASPLISAERADGLRAALADTAPSEGAS